MTVSQILLLGLYVPMACLLVLFGLHRAHILFEYLRTRKQNPKPEGRLRELPSVLVQIPVYNERAVLPRILGAVSKLDYPRDKLRIQVLDDSTDDTTEYAPKSGRAEIQQHRHPAASPSRRRRHPEGAPSKRAANRNRTGRI